MGLPPGAEPFSTDLTHKLDAALSAEGKAALERAHHIEGGAPRFTNRLLLETSPYLLQHAHNPVDWYPWGAEAFDEARGWEGRSCSRSATPPATGAT